MSDFYMQEPIMRNFDVGVGVMTRQEFARISGLTEDAVRGLIGRGKLPTVKLGRARVINMVLWFRELGRVE